jgi:hypothetical protein
MLIEDGSSAMVAANKMVETCPQILSEVDSSDPDELMDCGTNL